MIAGTAHAATPHYHFHDKEEIIFSAMEVLASGYRSILAKRFSRPQTLHDRIADLLRFIWSEVEKSPGEQLVLQEMTLYALRYPHAAHLAAEKEREIKALYVDTLMSASFVGILNQWLATRDVSQLLGCTDTLITVTQSMAAERLLVK